MNNTSPIVNPKSWEIPDPKWVLGFFERRKRSTNKVYHFANKGEISPLQLYCYLKARFGNPNGLSMLARNPSSDNVIQWQYTIKAGDSLIDFWGMNRQLEFTINTAQTFQSEDWQIVFAVLQSEFKEYRKEISFITKSLEPWVLFVNPFNRLNKTVASLESRLKTLTITEPSPVRIQASKKDHQQYFKEYKRWLAQIDEGALLGTSVRLIVPVFAESFINLLIFLLAKPDVKSNQRVYDNLLKDPIDVRVGGLHLHCDGFDKAIDAHAEEFKNFHTLMNSRNDFLHGNVNPEKLAFDTVYFDKVVPVFEDERSLAERLFLSSLKFVEPATALKDIQVARAFIEFTLQHISAEYRKSLQILMQDNTPGFRRDTKKVGNLFPNWIAEFYGMS
jgi:hypothetical protein